MNAKRKTMTMVEAAALEFAPVDLGGARLPRDWPTMFQPHVVTLQFAAALVEKTTPELRDTVNRLHGESDGLATLLDALKVSHGLFSGYAELLRAAEVRLLCAVSAAVVAGRVT